MSATGNGTTIAAQVYANVVTALEAAYGVTRYVTHVNGQPLPTPIAVAPGESIEAVCRAATGSTTLDLRCEWFES